MNPAERAALGKTDVRVTRMGLGTGYLGRVHTDDSWNEIIGAAWATGIRSYDTSPYYGFGNSEQRLGRALSRYKRDEYVLSTKVGRLLRADAPVDPFAEAIFYPAGMPEGVMRSVYDYSASATRQSVIDSRRRLGISRLDVVHIHDVVELASGIDHTEEAKRETYPVLAELRAKKEVGAIGVGAQVNTVLTELGEACDFDCFLIAGRYTLLDQSALEEVLPLCVRKNISVIIGSPYNTGILVDPGPDSTFDFGPAPPEMIEKAMRMKAVCQKYQRAAAGCGHSVSVRASCRGADPYRSHGPAGIEQNARLMQEKIPAELWQDLRSAGLINLKAPTPA